MDEYHSDVANHIMLVHFHDQQLAGRLWRYGAYEAGTADDAGTVVGGVSWSSKYLHLNSAWVCNAIYSIHLSSSIIIYHHLSSSIIIYHHLSLSSNRAGICSILHKKWFQVLETCSSNSSIYHHLLPSCHNLLSSIIVWPSISSFLIIYYYLSTLQY